MGWVSMNEDIEEMRQQRAHMAAGINNLRKWASKPNSRNSKDVDAQLNSLSVRVEKFLQELEVRVLTIFDDAEARLRDPNVRIVARLDKKTAELASLRDRLRKTQSDLAKSRQANEKLRDELVTCPVFSDHG
jgi:chromosome segregation ATPase